MPIAFNEMSNFHVAGINYRKADAALRGKFAISTEQYAEILMLAPGYGIHQVFVLSTCNRTEIYGFCEDAAQLIALLCTQTQAGKDIFEEMCYIKKDLAALEHLFAVAAGLDSQILGDYEIVGQLKKAVGFSREHNFIGGYLDRMLSSVLQSSKTIKNQTELSGGTVSVSFAAVQYIKQTQSNLKNKHVLLLGVGKIGRSTCRNLISYLKTTNITLINRTADKARALAEELGLQYASQEDLSQYLDKADIIIVATNASAPTLTKAQLENKGAKLIIDLSIPYNVEEEARHLPHVTLVNVDELSRRKDDTIRKREAEVPLARAIIREHMEEFIDWDRMRRHIPVLKAVKTKLQQIISGDSPHSLILPVAAYGGDESHEKIQKVINVMAVKMRLRNEGGCQYIEAINDFISPAAN